MSNRQNSFTPSITISDRGAAGEGSEGTPSSPTSGRKSPRLGLAFLRRKSTDAGAASDNEDEGWETGNSFAADRRPSIMAMMTSSARGRESDHEQPLSPHSQGGGSRPSSPLFGSTLKQWRSKSPFGSRRRGPKGTATEEETEEGFEAEPIDPLMFKPDPKGGGTGNKLSWGDPDSESETEAKGSGENPEGSGSGSGKRRIR